MRAKSLHCVALDAANAAPLPQALEAQAMNKHRLKFIALGGLLFSLLACSNVLIDSPEEEVARDIKLNTYSFLTWYDGWGGHTVWGVGKVGACFTCGSVMCGNTKVEFTVSYDTHTRTADSKYPQEKKFATTYNSMLLTHFKQTGQECYFELIPTTGGSASNK